jgi:hypothetical protein
MSQSIRVIGIARSVECVVYTKGIFTKNQFVSIDEPASKKKVLRLTRNNELDTLVERYGIIHKNRMCIDWPKLKKHYKGIYIKKSAILDRELDVPYHGQTYRSFVGYDFDRSFIYSVLIWVHTPTGPLGTRITAPFNGTILDSLLFDPTEFTRFDSKNISVSAPISDKSSRPILYLDSIKTFDQFTAQYGTLSHSSPQQIQPDWSAISKIYKGIYIDERSDIYDARNTIAFFRSKRYESWLTTQNIKIGVVYQFD